MKNLYHHSIFSKVGVLSIISQLIIIQTHCANLSIERGVFCCNFFFNHSFIVVDFYKNKLANSEISLSDNKSFSVTIDQLIHTEKSHFLSFSSKLTT